MEGANLALAVTYTRIHLLGYKQPAETQMDSFGLAGQEGPHSELL